MTTKQRLDWQEMVVRRALGHGWTRFLCVRDEMTSFCAELPPDMTAADGLADYAAGYYGCSPEVTVSWELYEDGAVIEDGSRTFAPIPQD